MDAGGIYGLQAPFLKGEPAPFSCFCATAGRKRSIAPLPVIILDGRPAFFMAFFAPCYLKKEPLYENGGSFFLDTAKALVWKATSCQTAPLYRKRFIRWNQCAPPVSVGRICFIIVKAFAVPFASGWERPRLMFWRSSSIKRIWPLAFGGGSRVAKRVAFVRTKDHPLLLSIQKRLLKGKFRRQGAKFRRPFFIKVLEGSAGLLELLGQLD